MFRLVCLWKKCESLSERGSVVVLLVVVVVERREEWSKDYWCEGNGQMEGFGGMGNEVRRID